MIAATSLTLCNYLLEYIISQKLASAYEIYTHLSAQV